ncbi:Monoterpene epsilon-lactone hydrolase [Globisporangium polare]
MVDSAGGGLVMSTLLGLRDANKSHLMALAAVSICGYFGLTKEPKDFVPPPHCTHSQSLMRGFRRAALVNPDDQVEARKYSAVYVDLRGLSPAFVQTASLDYLYRNSLDLITKAKVDGVRENWEVHLREGVALGTAMRGRGDAEGRSVRGQTDPRTSRAIGF